MENEQDNKRGISVLWWIAGVGVIVLLLAILYWVLSGGSFKNSAEAQVAATVIEKEVIPPTVVVNIAASQCCCDTKVSVNNVKKTYRKKIIKTQKPKHLAPPVAMSLTPARPVAALPPVVKQVEAKPLLDGTDTEYGKTKTVFIPNQPEPVVEEEPYVVVQEPRMVGLLPIWPQRRFVHSGYVRGAPTFIPDAQYVRSDYYTSPNIIYPEPPPFVPPVQHITGPSVITNPTQSHVGPGVITNGGYSQGTPGVTTNQSPRVRTN